MAAVNIRRDVKDSFYRYKCVSAFGRERAEWEADRVRAHRMPVLLTKIEGKGNGIKTGASSPFGEKVRIPPNADPRF